MDDSMKYFTETAPGVFALKKSHGGGLYAMASCWIVVAGLVVTRAIGWAYFNVAVYAFFAIVATLVSVSVLMDYLIMTTFDQNTRTVSGVVTQLGVLKKRATASFDDFHGFRHVTPKRKRTDIEDAPDVTRLDMTFLQQGEPTLNIPIMLAPTESQISTVCSEINVLMGN